jgi:cytochrome P450
VSNPDSSTNPCNGLYRFINYFWYGKRRRIANGECEFLHKRKTQHSWRDRMWITGILSVVAFLIAVLLVYALFLHLRHLWKYRHIPGVSQLCPTLFFRVPILAPYFYRGNWRTMIELSKRFERYPVYKATVFNETFVVLNSLEAVKHVYLKNAPNYPKPSHMYHALLMYGHNIVSAEGGELHKKHRRIVEPAFDEKHLRYLVEVSNQSTDLLLERLAKKKRIEVNSDFTDVTMDIIGKTNFGVDLHVFDEDAKHNKFDKTRHSKSFYDTLEVTNTLGLAFWNFVPTYLHDLPVFKAAKEAIDETRKYIEDIIEERKNSGEGKHLDLLSLLLESNSIGDSKLTAREILSDAFIFLFAGHETSATNLGHLLCELAKNKDIQEKCVEEIDRVLGKRDCTYDDIPNLKYVNNCIKESLRLHSPVIMVPKIAKHNDTICGYFVPKNTPIWIDFYGIHYNEKIWADATKFNPDRFNEKYNPLAFLSFSFGPRKCVGFNFSLIETAAILVRLLQRYTFEYGT